MNHLLHVRVGLAAVLAASLLASSGPAHALREAQAEANAAAAGDAGGSQLETRTGTAAASVVSLGDDEATADAIASSAGFFRSRSHAVGFSGGSAASSADARAAWYVDFVTTGSDPGVPVDLDLDLHVDGTLLHANNNSGSGAGDIEARVDVGVTIYAGENVIDAFQGSAILDTDTNATPPTFERLGDWAAPARDVDFSVGSCTAFSCQVQVDADIPLPDAASVGFGEVFAVEVQFVTRADIANGREVEAEADFLGTGTLALSTGAAGVTIVPVDPVPSELPLLAPGPLAALAVAVGLAGVLVARRGRRSEPDPEPERV